MWSRKELKRKAKRSIKQNYWRAIVISFLITLFAGANAGSTQLLRQNFGMNGDAAAAVEQFQKEHLNLDSKDLFVLDAATTTVGQYLKSKYAVSIALRFVDKLMETHFSLLFLLILTGLGMSFFYAVFVSNILIIGEKRFYMENRIYHETRIGKLLYLYKMKDIKNSAWIMFCRSLYQFLWSLTIIGGIIKYFEYALIPYLLAENPEIDKKTVFTLSKDMMRGNKWRFFLLKCSFLLWGIVGIFTLGITNIFFANSYKSATETELYMYLRRRIIAERRGRDKLFTDQYLEKKPLEDEILIGMFIYDESCTPSLNSVEYSKNTYPMFLRGNQSKWCEAPYKISRNQSYTWTFYVLLFFIASAVGWIFETISSVAREGVFAPSYTMLGPCIPIVGVCAVLVVMVGRKWIEKPAVTVGAIMLFGSAAEYGYSWYLEKIRNLPVWNFSRFFLNLNGRICVISVLMAGIAGSVLLYVMAPWLNSVLEHYPFRRKRRVCMILLSLFIVDNVASIMLLL